MAVMLYDISIEGSQLLTAGTKIFVSVDFTEVNGQSFTISSATMDLYDADTGVADDGVGTVAAAISTGLRSSKRVAAEISIVNTTGLDGQYYAIWTLTLADGQTRKAKQSIEFRAVA